MAVEVKLSSAPDVDDLRRLEHNADLIGADIRALISRTSRSTFGKTTWSCNLADFLDRLVDLAGP